MCLTALLLGLLPGVSLSLASLNLAELHVG